MIDLLAGAAVLAVLLATFRPPATLEPREQAEARRRHPSRWPA